MFKPLFSEIWLQGHTCNVATRLDCLFVDPILATDAALPHIAHPCVTPLQFYVCTSPSRVHRALSNPSDPDLSILLDLIYRAVLRARTVREILAISAADQGAALSPCVCAHIAHVRVHDVSASEQAGEQRPIQQPASSRSHLWNSSGRKTLVG